MKHTTTSDQGIPYADNSSCKDINIENDTLKKHLRQSRMWAIHHLAVMMKSAKLRSKGGPVHDNDGHKYRLNDQDIEEMVSAVNGLSNDFASRLHQKYELKQNMIVLCCLVLLGLKNKAIMTLLDMKESTIKKDKLRLKYEVFHLPREVKLRKFLIDFQDFDIAK